MNRLVVVTGTGTEIGKTHLGEALLLAAGARGLRAVGIKPIESGVGEGRTDADRLAAASTFHVKHEGVTFALPVSPHLAARAEGREIDLPPLLDWVFRVVRQAELTLVELPGGLLSPLRVPSAPHPVRSDDPLVTNADLAARLSPDAIVLVAPDRLGVLHDVLATTRAAATLSVPIDAVLLGAPVVTDASSGTNAGELRRILSVPVFGPVARGAVAELARAPELTGLLDHLLANLRA